MEKELLEWIRKNNLSPFNKSKTSVKQEESIFKTKDGKEVFRRVIDKLSKEFCFKETENIWNFFGFSNGGEEIRRRQDFFKSIIRQDGDFLKSILKPKPFWKPKYGVIAVTEDEKSFQELNKLGCAVQFLNNEYDLQSLDGYDLVQAVECDNFSSALERLEQSVFLDEVEDAYLERYVELLSGWKTNIELIEKECKEPEVLRLAMEIKGLFGLLGVSEKEKITREKVEAVLEEINEKAEGKIKEMTLSGDVFMKMLNGKLPEEISSMIKQEIIRSEVPEYLFKIGVPVSIEEQELDRFLKKQSSAEYVGVAEKIKRKSDELKRLPLELKKLEEWLLLVDFKTGVNKYLEGSFPECKDEIVIENSRNLLIENAQEISFNLNSEQRCSVLTGANSGGKTTLIEHIIQTLVLVNLGLSTSGKVAMPLFSEVYYFAKNKGASGKGAFENLLEQMEKIKTGKKTLILADEIEAVTEPGVAGRIIAATAEYFLERGCFLVIATHLGHEIQKFLPKGARIDGIEAKGLNENFELIVDHNPVLGRLANSTPELIVEKMAGLKDSEYFRHLLERVRNK